MHATHLVTTGLLVLAVAVHSQAEIIPSDRSITWQGNVGVTGGIPDRLTIYQTIAAGASLATVQNALNSCPANQVVYLSAGNYSWNGTLDWQGANRGVVLRGAGPGSTIIIFTGGSPPIYMRAGFNQSSLTTSANLNADATKGSTTLMVSSVPSWVTVGGLIAIDQIDDPSFVAAEGTNGGESYRQQVGAGPRGLAQLNRVVAKTGTTITVETPLYYGWRVAQRAQIWQPGYDPSQGNHMYQCGIENLKLVAAYAATDAQMIKMESCDSCWIKNVETANVAGGAHIQTNFCYRCEIRDSYSHDSHSYDSGQGYGVALYNVTSGTLVENNIIRNYHDGLSAQYGSSGNVFGYNYCFGGQSVANQNPSISTHGTHAYMNLWEGNYCIDKVLFDWTHGSGSHETVFRNRIVADEPGQSMDQTCISIEYYNRFCNIVGNILGMAGFQNLYMSNLANHAGCDDRQIYKIGGYENISCDWTTASDSMAVSSPIIHGNFDTVTNGVIWDPNISDHTLPNSHYLMGKPSWFGNLPWPPFAPSSPSVAAVENLPAGYRYINGIAPLASASPAPPANLRVVQP
jgi:hypothetical protein